MNVAMRSDAWHSARDTHREALVLARREVTSGAKRRGLVTESTSRPQGLPTAIQWAQDVVTVDPALARVTRLRKSIGVAAKLLHNMGARKERRLMVTLTYRGDNRNWAPHHISDYIHRVRKWANRLGVRLRYVWVAELQERGVIHYHVVFWLPASVTLPKADKRGWWPHGMTKTEVAHKPIGYLMSYVSKVESKNVGEFPHGARIHGCGGLDASARGIRRWVLWPSYVQGNSAVGECWRPAKGGGYVNHDDGRFLRSEFAPTGGGFCSFVRVFTHPREIEAAGPFSWLVLDASRTVH